MNRRWELHQRPAGNVCPEEFCFHWGAIGDRISPPGRVYASPREALLDSVNWPVLTESSCACRFGICHRLQTGEGTADYYEPCEPRLEAAGLPWFYFCTLDGLKQEFQQEFLTEASQLWGPAAIEKPIGEETA